MPGHPGSTQQRPRPASLVYPFRSIAACAGALPRRDAVRQQSPIEGVQILSFRYRHLPVAPIPAQLTLHAALFVPLAAIASVITQNRPYVIT